MRFAVSADEVAGVADAIGPELERRGHTVELYGALAPGQRADWAWCSEAAARAVAEGRVDQAVVACWTGAGASIAANKVPGIRAALCTDAVMADGARRWADANITTLNTYPEWCLASGAAKVRFVCSTATGAPPGT